jgi:ribosomal protein S18 acetylase RimI-like enzyme
MLNRANENDIPQLLQVINAAYRGNESRKGWTTEANLIDGEIRTDKQVLQTLIRKRGSVILKFIQENEIVGCVHLENQNGKLHLGMLSVSPSMQGKNIGKTLLRAAEEYAAANNVGRIVMHVINLRHELIDWYERHGYKKTGETKPFPLDHKFGIPRQSLEFIVLEKKILESNYFH